MSKTNRSSDRIIDLTFEIARVMRQMHATTHDKKGLNFLQIHALALISEHAGMTMKKLADYLHVASPSATAFVDRLVKLKYVKRLHDPANRKIVPLKITPLGSKILKKKLHAKRQAFKYVLQSLPLSEQDSLAKILQKLLTSLSKHQS